VHCKQAPASAIASKRFFIHGRERHQVEHVLLAIIVAQPAHGVQGYEQCPHGRASHQPDTR